MSLISWYTYLCLAGRYAVYTLRHPSVLCSALLCSAVLGALLCSAVLCCALLRWVLQALRACDFVRLLVREVFSGEAAADWRLVDSALSLFVQVIVVAVVAMVAVVAH